MALIDIACPGCKKPMKAPDTLQGKKIRCKSCGHTFTLAPPPAAKSRVVDDEDDVNPYGIIQEDESIPRCPDCAQVMESAEAVICLHCGYNRRTRAHMATKKVIATTGNEHFMWLLPGILCVVGILVLIGFDLFYCLAVPKMVAGGESEWIAARGFRTWAVIASFFLMAFMGKFAYQRLIVNPAPAEQEKEI